MIPFLLLSTTKRKAVLKRVEKYALTSDGYQVARVLLEELGDDEEEIRDSFQALVLNGSMDPKGPKKVLVLLKGDPPPGDWKQVLRRRPAKLRNRKCTLT
jgi:hypothetical protein